MDMAGIQWVTGTLQNTPDLRRAHRGMVDQGLNSAVDFITLG